MTVRTQPNPRLIPEGDKRFPFPPGWVHPIEGPHSGMHHMTTRKPKPPPDTSASKGWQQAAKRQISELQGPTVPERDWRQLFELHDRIKPPEGWRPVAAEGFRMAQEAVRVDLVRLRDVADWLALGDSRDAVLRRCLGQLVDADLYPLCMFYVLDPDREPVRVLDRFHASVAAATALGLPGVYPMSEPIEVAAWLLEAWWRVWPGHSDISQAVDRVEIIKRRREDGRRSRLTALGLTESDVEDEPAYWPADDVLLASLNRLALPVFVAFDLWGYGVDTAESAVDVEAAAATSASNVVPFKPDDLPSDATNDAWWLEWCASRNAANTNPDGTAKHGNARAKWKGEDVQVLGLRRSTLMGRGLADSTAKNAMAADLKMTTQGIGKQLEKLGTSEAVANIQAAQKVN